VTLSLEARQEYVDIIDTIWQGSMNYNSAENITAEVVSEMNFIFSEIKTCSSKIDDLMEALTTVFADIYLPGVIWLELIKKPSKKGHVKNWIIALRGNGAHLACVVTAAANWKSSLQMKLMGL